MRYLWYFASIVLCAYPTGLVAEERIFAPGSKLKIEAGSGSGGEGPAWDAQRGVFSSGNGHTYLLDRAGRSRIFRKNSGTNGLLFDSQGRLLACESAFRRITRMERDGKITVLTARYDGKHYNETNDLALDSGGRVYFSDPCYGPRAGKEMFDKKRRLIEAVYRLDPDGMVTRLTGRELERPNGVLVSADDRYLYLAANNNNALGGVCKLWRFNLNKDGTLNQDSKKLLYDWGQG